MISHEARYEAAKRFMPGGVNSSTRVNRALGIPVYASHAEGSRVVGVDGREFIDMCCAHGAALLGHNHPTVGEAVKKAATLGFVHAFETEYHEELAGKVCGYIPCAERVRFCSSGSEATLHLIRACRAFTGRKKIIRFEGHFHGYHELIYIGGHPPESAIPGNRTKPYVESPGIPDEYADHVIPLPFNDRSAFDDAIERHGDETALVILEPVNFNCAGILPGQDYLDHLRDVTRNRGIILFFDEIQSSFKKSLGGAQEYFGVVPDVCTIGKSLGGGFPLSAFCGRADIMDMFKPVGSVQHSGTFNAHIVPVLAGLAFFTEAEKPEFYQRLKEIERRLREGFDAIIRDNGLNMIAPHHGARFNIVLGRKTPALRYEDTFCHSVPHMLGFIRACWERGVYFHDYGGGPLHHGYSIRHTDEDIDRVLDVFETVAKSMKKELV